MAMWFFREIFRLIWNVAVATAIAAALAVLWSLASTGSFRGQPLHHDMRVSFLLVGCIMLMLATGGNRSTASARRTNWGIRSGVRGYSRLSSPVRARPGDPTLNPSAVFGGSAIVLFALGFVV